MAGTPSSSRVEMDQETAKKLFHEGGTFVLLNMPPGTEFGIDLNSWNTGEKFKGVKMIPPGVHFIYYSAVNKEGNTAPRIGFFHVFRQCELLAKRWDRCAEDISEEDVNAEESKKLQDNLEQLDKNLGAYPYDSWRKWVSLAGRITEAVLARLQPNTKKIMSAPSFVFDDTAEATPPKCQRMTAEERENAKLPRMKPLPGTEFNFTSFPERNYPEGSSAADITKHSMDSSYVLECMLERYGDHPEDILAELQMAFTCFLVGQNYDSFEHWKKLIHVLCSCDEALNKFGSLYMNLLSDLYFQIQEIPEDCFVDIVTSNNFIYNALQKLYRNITEHEHVDEQLKVKMRKFKAFVTKKFEWDFDEEEDDDAPVVVEDV